MLMGLVLLVLCIVAVEWLVRGSVQPSVEVVPVAATSTASEFSTSSSAVARGQTSEGGHAVTKGTSKVSYAAVVIYTSKGFSPSVVRITAGQVVHFVNESNLGMRVHTVTQGAAQYVGLDQQQVVGKGGTYDFLFNDPGTWSYLNLVGDPGLTGIVIVSPQ